MVTKLSNEAQLKAHLAGHGNVSRYTSDVMLDGADLYGANLTGADLYGANLRGANLYEANLSRANLYGADLQRADLEGANLYEANLSRANLYGANLEQANLEGADLYGANLRGANLRGANLYGANLQQAKNIVSVTGVGSEGRTVYFVNHDCIMVQAGCFWGTVDELLDKSSRQNGEGSDHYAGYKAACEYAKIILAQHRVKYGEVKTESQT